MVPDKSNLFHWNTDTALSDLLFFTILFGEHILKRNSTTPSFRSKCAHNHPSVNSYWLTYLHQRCSLYLWPMMAIPVSLRFFDLLNSMIYYLKRSLYLRWLFNPVQYSSLDDFVLMLKCYLLIYWAPFEFPFFWYVWYSFVNTVSTKTYVVLVAKQMLKHLRIAKNYPFKCPGKLSLNVVMFVLCLCLCDFSP